MSRHATYEIVVQRCLVNLTCSFHQQNQLSITIDGALSPKVLKFDRARVFVAATETPDGSIGIGRPGESAWTVISCLEADALHALLTLASANKLRCVQVATDQVRYGQARLSSISFRSESGED